MARDHEEAERAYDEEVRLVIDLTQDDNTDELSHPGQQQSNGRRGRYTERNAPLHNSHRSVPAYRVQGVRFRVRDFVELAQPVGMWHARFIEVKQIWVNASEEVLLRGLPYARNRDMGGRFELRTNEVCQILEIDVDDDRPDQQQAMMEVRPQEILSVRDFHKTNTDYHSARNCRFGNDPTWLRLGNSAAAVQRRQDHGPLTCRWKMRLEYHDARFRRAGKAFGTSISHLTESEVDDPYYRIPDEQRRRDWLKRDPVEGRQYTFADAFCGCGGASSGARMAGFEPTIAIDSWEPACESYRRNFRHTHLFREDIGVFITQTNLDDFHLPDIDLLHISPPCQFFSGAKVNEGKNDEANEVALWACEELVKKIRPRYFTMEQTYGLLQSRFTLHFNKLIQGFTKYGYSIQWRERVELIQYGLPQNRKRLIIVGAAPGEDLPPWPAPTHGNGQGRPWVTEAQAIGRFPANVTHHDVRGARRHDGGLWRSPNAPLMRTIVCSGAQGVIHYSGQRDYTLREFATLQGFPLNHEFVGPARGVIMKQIGNAFPASVARVFYQNIRRFLESQDRARASVPAPARGLPPPTPRLRAMGGGRALPDPSITNDRRRAQHTAIGGAEAAAAQQSRAQSPRQRHPQWREVIVISDSDESDDLPDQVDSLGVEPLPAASSSSSSSSPPIQKPSASNLSASSSAQPQQKPQPQQTTSPWSESASARWSLLSTPSGAPIIRTPSSAASSVTLDNDDHSPRPSLSPSPCPSPCQQQQQQEQQEQQSRKRRPSNDVQRGSTREKRTRDGDKGKYGVVDEIVMMEACQSAAQEEPATGSSSRRAVAVERLAAKDDHYYDGRPLAFGNWLGKLPVTRATSEDWEL